MDTLLQTIIALGAIWVLAYQRARMETILFLLTLLLVLMSWLWGFVWLTWLVLVLVGFFYFAEDIRKQWLTRPIYNFFKRVLPPMSTTEMEALEAGDVWWEAELFQGDPDWKEFMAFPKPELNEEEQAFIDN